MFTKMKQIIQEKMEKGKHIAFLQGELQYVTSLERLYYDLPKKAKTEGWTRALLTKKIVELKQDVRDEYELLMDV